MRASSSSRVAVIIFCSEVIGLPFREMGFFLNSNTEKIPQEVVRRASIRASATGPSRRGPRIVFIVGCRPGVARFGQCYDVTNFLVWACGAVGSALPWHGRGQGFESLQVHQNKAQQNMDLRKCLRASTSRKRSRGVHLESKLAKIRTPAAALDRTCGKLVA